MVENLRKRALALPLDITIDPEPGLHRAAGVEHELSYYEVLD